VILRELLVTIKSIFYWRRVVKKSTQKLRVFRGGLLGILVLALFFVSNAQTAKADIKATEPFYVWDRDTGKFVNSNAALWLDTDWWVPMIHQISNDKDDYPVACGTTTWAGELTMGLGHVDTTGGHGLQSSDSWTLVECDRTGDGDFNNDDLNLQLDENAELYGFIEWTEVSSATFEIIASDVITDCSNNTCNTELITTMFMNLDPDCDGVINNEPPGGICFYAEAQPPSASMQPYWQGNLQARISAGGGDKTVNFQVAGPNAVRLVNFSAQSQDSHWMLYLAGFLTLVGCVVIMLIYKKNLSILATQEEH
jgi:hypothetical protein